MEPPSTRELELEVLLRQRETQLAELKDEAISLRRYLAKQPGPSKTELVSLPPAVLAVLRPHIESQVGHTASSVSATVAGGLNQRMRQLQEENDELYNLLKSTETGKLKDEVRSLRRAVAKLEGALKESHQVISSLSEELEKTHEVLMSTSRHKDLVQPYPRAYSDSPRSSYRPELSTNQSTNSKPPPTGPRAHKRPRLLEPLSSPPARPMVPLPPKPQIQNHVHQVPPHSHNQPPIGPMRDQGRQPSSVQDKDNLKHDKASTKNSSASDLPHRDSDSKMELDSPDPTSPATIRERDRIRERERNNKERERRDRESRDNNSSITSTLPSKPPPNTAGRRNGSNYSNASGRAGGGGASARKTPGRSHSQSSDNRTLQQRMGL